jgi:uncharacterized membrane-anchored protein YjiN (DUF445 family)
VTDRLIPLPAAERVRALRRMKVVATGLLVVAAVVYGVCRGVWHGHGAAGYVQAAAEASMVGGLADWFAVTALFRYPLGLRIPHTAIIPRKKDQIGEGLAGFVNEYFITPEIVGERLALARVPQRVGDWLADPVHARQVADELSKAVGGLASVLRDDELRNAVATFADRRLRELEVSPLLGRVLETVCDAGQHQAILTSGLRGLMRFLDENQSVLRRRLDQESPEWVPEWVDDRVFAKAFSAVQSFLADVSVDDDHELRRTYDVRLRDLARRLQSDPQQAARVERAKLDLLDRPDVRDWLSQLWLSMKKMVLDGAVDPDSALRRSVQALTLTAGSSLRDDPAVVAKVDEALQRLAGHVVAQYGNDLAGIISATVERWDTAETSRRLELQVGRDLQFIRLNGTVVGSLAGLAIYTLSQLL